MGRCDCSLLETKLELETKLPQSLRGTSVCGVEDGRKEVLEVCLQSVQVLGEIRTLRKITGV